MSEVLNIEIRADGARVVARDLESLAAGTKALAAQTAATVGPINAQTRAMNAKTAAIRASSMAATQVTIQQKNLAQAQLIAARTAMVQQRANHGLATSFKSAGSEVYFLRRAMAALGVSFGLRETAQMIDSYINLENRIKTVSKSTESLSRTTDRLFAVADETRTGIDETVLVYQRVARAGERYGATQKRVIEFTRTLNQATQVGGAGSREATQAIIQLSQAMGSGVLRGDELRSVMEQMPLIADVIAKQLGVTSSELKKLGEEGKITSREIFLAMEKAAPKIAADYKKLTPTISQSLTTARNHLVRFIGEFDKAHGVSRAFAQAMQFLTSHLHEIASGLGLVAVAWASAFGARTLLNMKNILGMVLKIWGVLRAHPLSIVLSILGALAGATAYWGRESEAIQSLFINLRSLAHGIFQFIVAGVQKMISGLSKLPQLLDMVAHSLGLDINFGTRKSTIADDVTGKTGTENKIKNWVANTMESNASLQKRIDELIAQREKVNKEQDVLLARALMTDQDLADEQIRMRGPGGFGRIGMAAQLAGPAGGNLRGVADAATNRLVTNLSTGASIDKGTSPMGAAIPGYAGVETAVAQALVDGFKVISLTREEAEAKAGEKGLARKLIDSQIAELRGTINDPTRKLAQKALGFLDKNKAMLEDSPKSEDPMGKLAPFKPPVDEKGQKALDNFIKSLESLIAKLDPVAAAQMEMAETTDILTEAMHKKDANGKPLITQERANELMRRQGELLDAQLHPLETMVAAQEEQRRLLEMDSFTREKYVAQLEAEKELRAAMISPTEEMIKLVRDEAAATLRLTQAKEREKEIGDWVDRRNEEIRAFREGVLDPGKGLRDQGDMLRSMIPVAKTEEDLVRIGLAMRNISYEQLRLKQGGTDWEQSMRGVDMAAIRIRETIRQTATETEQVMLNAFGSVEQFLVTMTTEFRLDFRSLVNSLLADMTKLTFHSGLKALMGEDSKSIAGKVAESAAQAAPFIAAGGIMRSSADRLIAAGASVFAAAMAMLAAATAMKVAAGKSGGSGGTVGGAIANAAVPRLMEALPLQTGGQFMVGGRPGPDANPVLMNLTRGERVTVETQRMQKESGGGGAAQQNLIVFDADGVTQAVVNSPALRNMVRSIVRIDGREMSRHISK